MFKRMCLLSILLLLTITACREGPIPSTKAAPDMEVPQISAQVELLPEDGVLLVSEHLTYRNCQREALSEIYLYTPPSAFAAESATVQDFFLAMEEGAFSYDSSDPPFLCITPESPLSPGDQVCITLQYQLMPSSDPASFGAVDGAYQLTRFVFAPALYRDGWVLNLPHEPGESAVLEPASYRVEVIAPPQYQVAASGVRLEEDGVIFASDFARDFALYLSPDHLEKTISHEGLSLHFYYKESQARYLDNWISSAQRALTFYLETFGPLKTKDLSLVFTNDRSRDGGLECSDLMFFYFDNLFDLTQASISQEMDMVIAHELAHQWFYHLLGNNQGMEPFLDEGFATWAETMYLRAQGSFDAATLEGLHQNIAARGAGEKPILGQSVYDFSDLGRYSYDIYYGGASLLYQMEKSLGEDHFRELLHDYVTHFRLGFVTTEDFLSYWHTVAGDTLDPLFSLYLGE